MNHTSMTVISIDRSKIQDVRNFALTIPGLNVTEMIETDVNFYYTFSILPCGSKMYWQRYDINEDGIESVKEFINELAYEDGSNIVEYAITRFGEVNNSLESNR